MIDIVKRKFNVRDFGFENKRGFWVVGGVFFWLMV